MLRSAIVAVRSAALQPEHFRQLNYVQLSRLFGSQLRSCSAQSSPNTSSSKHDASTEQKTAETDTKTAESTKEAKESEHDRLLKEKEGLLKDLQDKYKRSLADNENILTRSRKQIDESRLFGIQTFSKDLLEVADILGKATETVPTEEIEKNIALKNLYEGLLMTEAQLQKVFKKNGLEKIHPMDEKFDPYSHEALFQIPFPDKEKGTVAVVEKVGYKLHGRTLRPALVGVVKE
ncbi:GrpE protein 1, mitochondrial [Desmophyllum pertusum]|uniref:GrpE protein homolog n=1 Tax=Desmophyllum pertusum TaxID=174260 RepID=A0A9W9ZR33_9CNID|nr:GrpE protein 1, mitochondrial [Desmophyllum pertusum]